MTITRPSIWADSRLSLSLVSVSRPYLGSDDFSRPRLFGRYPALSRGRVSATSRSFLVRLTLDHSCSAAFRPSLGYRRSVGCHSLGRPSSDARLSLGRVSVIIRPSRDRVSAITWPSRNHLVVVSRGCHSADLRYEWPFLCHLRLAADRPSVRPAPFGRLSIRALSVAFDAYLATDCLCLSIRIICSLTLRIIEIRRHY